MKKLILTGLIVLVAACASKQTGESTDAKSNLEDKFSKRIGHATKQDFIQEFGPANWCRQEPSGEEKCRFYKKITTKWMGEKKDRVSREAFDEAFADFDLEGVLKSVKVNAQR
jgi:3-methyladenine DNA glycosylase Tag